MEKTFFQRLQKVKLKDILSLFKFILAIIPSLLVKSTSNPIWIISDCEDEARDNGYYFFKYIMDNKLDVKYNKKIYFAIHKNSYDYPKVSQLGKVVEFGSLMHWILYLACELNISSQKGCKPNAAIGFVLEKLNIIKHKIIFLQHGVIKDDLPYVHYENAKFKMFTTSVQREYEYVRDNYGYKHDEVKLLGLCRFDDLINEDNRDIILVMPTWRQWISNGDSKTKGIEDVSQFTNTEYFQKWSSLLKNEELLDYLRINKMKLYFYPHRHMQQYLSNFNGLENDMVEIANFPQYDVHTLLKKSSLLITDYSSVAMDFAYMDKPVIYYQFDYERFRENHLSEGYYSYKDDGFGPIHDDEDELVKNVIDMGLNNFELKEEYRKRIKSFFTLRDNHNCERTFSELIKGLKNEK
jgi:hypothetical protein